MRFEIDLPTLFSFHNLLLFGLHLNPSKIRVYFFFCCIFPQKINPVKQRCIIVPVGASAEQVWHFAINVMPRDFRP